MQTIHHSHRSDGQDSPDRRFLDLLPAAVADLRSTVRGTVHYPGDPQYDDLAAGHNTAVRHQPAVIVAAVDADDVSAAVTVAGRYGLTVHVQATGHGATAPVLGGIMITTGRLATIEIDDTARTVRVGAGTRWAAVADACAAVGLAAPGMANDGTVGVVGYTLGGGIGPMARAFGFSADHVTSIDVVPADGLVRTVDGRRGADLFWALLGGKYGLGIVTAMTLQLIEAPQLFAATVVYAAPDIPEALHSYARWAGRLPPMAGASAGLMRLPDSVDLPPPLRGQTILQIDVVLVGEPAHGPSWLAELIGDSAPMMSTHGITDPAQWLRDHPGPPPMPSFQRARLLHSLTPDTVSALLDAAGPDHELPLLGFELRCLDGALAAPAGGAANSVGGRDGKFLLNALGAPVPELFGTAVPHSIDGLFRAVAPWALPTSQVNFHGPYDERHPAGTAWPAEVGARLAGVRRRHDPDRIFARPTGL